MKKLILALLVFNSCGVDVSGDEEVTTTDNSVRNGVSECKYECEPIDGGFIVSYVCDGIIQDGPNLLGNIPEEGCAFEESEVDSNVSGDDFEIEP